MLSMISCLFERPQYHTEDLKVHQYGPSLNFYFIAYINFDQSEKSIYFLKYKIHYLIQPSGGGSSCRRGLVLLPELIAHSQAHYK